MMELGLLKNDLEHKKNQLHEAQKATEEIKQDHGVRLNNVKIEHAKSKQANESKIKTISQELNETRDEISKVQQLVESLQKENTTLTKEGKHAASQLMALQDKYNERETRFGSTFTVR